MNLTNSNFICKILTSVQCSLMMVFAFTYNTDNGRGDKEPNSFGFSTISAIQLNVKHDVPDDKTSLLLPARNRRAIKAPMIQISNSLVFKEAAFL